ASWTGSAYVYDFIRHTAPMALNSPSPAISDHFSSSLAVSGTRVVVGAPSTDAVATDSGSVYVYDVASHTPTGAVAKLNYPNPAEQDGFGGAIAISGTRLVVGAVSS